MVCIFFFCLGSNMSETWQEPTSSASKGAAAPSEPSAPSGLAVPHAFKRVLSKKVSDSSNEALALASSVASKPALPSKPAPANLEMNIDETTALRSICLHGCCFESFLIFFATNYFLLQFVNMLNPVILWPGHGCKWRLWLQAKSQGKEKRRRAKPSPKRNLLPA